MSGQKHLKESWAVLKTSFLLFTVLSCVGVFASRLLIKRHLCYKESLEKLLTSLMKISAEN